ncbi:MAG: NAD(P)/FAD-dependent oxidoreductase, partial [Proteobacteria bacterium]|nr:NAD(P)/FAD-dependent oxidoreductase [Pseudomonadota bacterium]
MTNLSDSHSGSHSGRQFDVAIVGGGPAGLTHACYMALSGRNVILFEQAEYPRHQIGESLLPFSWEVFDEIKFSEKLRNSGFIEKYGARFFSERSQRSKIFRFSDSVNPKHPMIYHVGRDIFDEQLRDHAVSLGVQVVQPHSVKQIVKDDAGVSIDREWRAKILVRASGITTMQSMPDNYIPNAPEDNATGVYSYFKYKPKTGTILDGDILIDLFYVDDNCHVPCWAWAIPISQEVMSVGFVLRTHQFAKIKQNGLSLNEMGNKILKSLPSVVDTIENADEPLEDYRMRFNFQRVAKQIVFDREVLIGDAAGFIDPVFSSGVHIGLRSAQLSAAA